MLKTTYTFFIFLLFCTVIHTEQNQTKSCISHSCTTIPLCLGLNSTNHLITFKNSTQTLCKPGCWKIAEKGIYTPANTATASPAFKITSSYTQLDFAGHALVNSDTTLAGWIGIEVGYTPAELAADPTLTQPKNIILSNVHLKNFDCGILVHKGVEKVLIQDSVILESSLGILMLGNDATFAITCPTTAVAPDPDDRISCAGIVNCKIIGHEQNRHDALVNLKTRLETTYGYDTDYFMPLRADRIAFTPPATTTALDRDVYTYSGILASHIKNLLISCTTIQCTGNSDFAAEGAGTRTEAIGIIVRDSDEVSVEHTKAVSTYGNVKATGIQLERVCGLNIYDSEFSYGTSDFIASGIESFPDSLAKTLDSICSGFDFTLEEVDLCEVKTEFQRSADIANGIYITDTRGLNGQDVFAQRNIATNSALGLSSITSVDITFTDSSFTRNFAGAATTTLKSYKKPFSFAVSKRSLGSLGTNDGIYAIGFFAEQTNNITCNNITCNKNIGENSGRGMQLIACQNCDIQSSSFSENQGTTKRTDEDTQIRAAQDISELSKHGPVLDETITGGYGCVIDTDNIVFSENITIDSCLANYNNGHRSAGFIIKNGSNIKITNSSASFQFANGTFLSEDVQSLNPTSVEFIDIQKSLFASNACDVNPTFTDIDYVEFLRNFIEEIEDTRENQSNGVTPAFTNEETITAGISLATSSMARFRLWGTALGIHIHNVKKFIIDSNNCIGQVSEQDSAIGILISGRSREFEIINCKLSSNEAWSNSAQALWVNSPDSENFQERYQYDLSAMKDFWYMTSGSFTDDGWLHAATTSDIGFFTGVGNGAKDAPDIMIAQGEQFFGNAAADTNLPFITPGGTGKGNSNNGKGKGGNNVTFPESTLIPPIAPTAAGFLCSDLAVSGYIAENEMNNNIGNSGHAFGISCQNIYNTTFSDNIILNNKANIYGLCYGILDCSSYSPNIFVRNFCNNNTIKEFMNANTLIPMGNIAGQTLQIDTLENGSYNRDDRSLFNLEVTMPIDADFCTVESSLDKAVQSNIVDQWNSNNWI